MRPRIIMDRTRLMALPSSVMVGSMALGVDTRKSDFDVCILESELPQGAYIGGETYQYGDQSLLLNKARLFKQDYIDCFLFNNAGDLESVRTIMDEMHNWPQFLLAWKFFRVKLFRHKLRQAGF